MAKKALIVSVSKSSVQGFDPLPGAEANTTLWCNLVGVLGGFTIKVLPDENATASAILDAVEHWLIAGSQTDDVLILAISAHGTKGGIVAHDDFVPKSALQALYAKSGAGARLYCVYDCCNASGFAPLAQSFHFKYWFPFVNLFSACAKQPLPADVAKVVAEDTSIGWIEIGGAQPPNIEGQYDETGGDFTWCLEQVVRSSPGLSTRNAVVKTSAEMFALHCYSLQIPKVRGPKVRLDRKIFS
jgi:hypothetical protein